MKFTHDCAIIGAGPAGLVAALYLKRYRRSVVVVENGKARVLRVPKIRNLASYGHGISGKSLLRKLKAQVKLSTEEHLKGEAQVFKIRGGFEVRVGHRKVKVPAVILASGMTDHEPPVDNLDSLCGKGVLAYCPICDGYDHSEEHIAILIQNARGFHKVKFVANFSHHLSIVAIKKFKVSPAHKALLKKLGAKFHQGELERLTYNTKRDGLDIKLESRRPFFAKLAYVALGSCANVEPVKNIRGLRKTKDRFLMTTSHQETSVPGLYAIGDCVNALSQVSVAVGHAAIAATRVHNQLG